MDAGLESGKVGVLPFVQSETWCLLTTCQAWCSTGDGMMVSPGERGLLYEDNIAWINDHNKMWHELLWGMNKSCESREGATKISGGEKK